MSAVRTSTGRRIHFDDLGTGSPLLGIPGAMAGRRSLIAPLVRALANRHRIIAMDLRDEGENEPESEYYTMADLVGDAVAVLDAVGVEQAHVLGYSLGGVVAQQLTLNHPERVERLIVMSSFSVSTRGHRRGDPMPSPEAWWSDDPFERIRNSVPYVIGPPYKSKVGDAELRVLGEADNDNRITWEGMMRQQAAQAGVDLRPRLNEIRAPTFVIHGDADPIILPDRGETVAQSISGARLRMLPGGGHLPWIDQPEVVTRMIMEFLAEADE